MRLTIPITVRKSPPSDRASLDRPWRRPGAARYALTRLRQMARPSVDVHEPAPGAVVVDRDVAVPTRDGTVLRVNVHRPPGPVRSRFCCRRTRTGRTTCRGARVWTAAIRCPFQYRALRQTDRVRFSSLTSWKAPDPAWWTAQGFAVVNADLRGAGNSDGVFVRLVVAGRWLWPRNPLTGQFPTGYEGGPRGRCTLHWGPDRQARLLVPVIGQGAE